MQLQLTCSPLINFGDVTRLITTAARKPLLLTLTARLGFVIPANFLGVVGCGVEIRFAVPRTAAILGKFLVTPFSHD